MEAARWEYLCTLEILRLISAVVFRPVAGPVPTRTDKTALMPPKTLNKVYHNAKLDGAIETKGRLI